jgi:hypothetical protein
LKKCTIRNVFGGDRKCDQREKNLGEIENAIKESGHLEFVGIGKELGAQAAPDFRDVAWYKLNFQKSEP